MESIEKHLGPSSQNQNFDVQQVETDCLRILDLEVESRNEKNLYKGWLYTGFIAAACYIQVKNEKFGLRMSHYIALCRNKGFPRPAIGIKIIEKW